MDNKKDNNEITDDVTDKDLIDLNENDEVIGDDVILDKESESLINTETTEDFKDLASTDADNTEKTVGELVEESETLSDAFKSDPEVDKVVDDIVRAESDELIAEADAKIVALQEKKTKPSFNQKIKNILISWWENRPVRYGTLFALFIILIVISLLPASRYAVLNVLGVRVTSSFVVVDSQTRLPLKDISVQLQEKVGDTNHNGEIFFDNLKLGQSELNIAKRGYAERIETIVLGWGSNPLGEQQIVATGEQFTFLLSDWKSNEPVIEAEATSGENSARADDSGKIVLTIGEDSISNIEVTINAKNYRSEKFTTDQLTKEEIEVKLVPSKKHTFVSNRNGEYDLYTIDVDGKNEKLLLKASGEEREVPIVTTHPTKDLVAYTSSREGEQNKDGFIVDGLFIIDTITGDLKRIFRSEQLQVIGWSDDFIVYLQVVEGTSAGNIERSKLVSYNYFTGEIIDLATANYFNDVELIGSKLYYAISSYAVPESYAKLFTVNVNGRDNNKLIDNQVWNIFRTTYDTFLFSTENQKWFTQVANGLVVEISQKPSPISKKFVDSPDKARTVWIEIRDGKGVLLKSNTDNFKEELVISIPGLYDVLYWANNSTVIVRVISINETADYVLNLDGGEMQKITDVTATRNTYF